MPVSIEISDPPQMSFKLLSGALSNNLASPVRPRFVAIVREGAITLYSNLRKGDLAVLGVAGP